MSFIKSCIRFTGVLLVPCYVWSATFHFSTSGNDANPGTENRPKETLSHAAELLLPGNTIRLKRGDTWYIGSSQWEVTGKHGNPARPIVVEAYGAGPKPAIAAMFLLRDNWRGAGKNRWAYNIADISQCFLNGARLKPVAALEDLKDPRECFLASDRVYIISTVNPNDEGVRVEAAGSGRSLWLSDSSHITFRDIEFKGGGGGGVVQLYAPTSHVTLESCFLRMASGYGLYFQGPDDGAAVHTRPIIRNCLLDKVWSKFLNSEIAHGGDGIRTSAPIEYALIQGNRITNFGHTSMKLHLMKNSIVELNETFAGESNYLRSLACYDPTSADNIIRRNYFHDMHQPSKYGGLRNKYYSNVIVRHSRGFPATQKTQGLAVSMGGLIFEAKYNYFVNNTIYDAEQTSLSIQTHGAKQNYVINNVFAVVRSGYAIRSYREVGEPQVVENNCLWNGNSTDELVYMTNASYTVADADQVFAEWSGNIQQDPLFVDPKIDDFRLSAGSPCAKGGKNIADVMGPGFVDFDGRPWDPKNPSIGAFQFTPDSSLSAIPIRSRLAVYVQGELSIER